LPADAPAGEFSASRAVETIRAIAGSPRLVGSPAFEQARDYLLGELAALGLATETQDTTLAGVKVENTLSRLEGRSSSEAILLVAHLDSVAETPGAMDDASGVATVLETARALKAGPALANTIMVLITGPEENCCYGAKAFATQHPWARDVRLLVNVDAGGVSGPSILAATGLEEGWLIRQMAGVLPDPIGSSAIEAFGSPATDYSLELRQDGFSGFDFNLSWTKRIHTPLDNVNDIHPASLQHQGEHMLAVARHFGDIPLDYPREPRPIYFDILGLTIVHYPVAWAIPLFLGLTLVMAWVLFLGFRRKRLGLRGVTYGALSLLLSLLTVPLLLILVERAIIIPLMTARPEARVFNELFNDSLLSNSLRWGAAILAMAAAGVWFTLFHRAKGVGWNDLVLGSFLLLFVAAGVTSVAFPGISYLLVWPLLFGLIAWGLRFSSIAKGLQGLGWPAYFGDMAAALVAILLFLPGILIAMLSLDIWLIYYVPVLVAAFGGFFIGPITVLVG